MVVHTVLCSEFPFFTNSLPDDVSLVDQIPEGGKSLKSAATNQQVPPKQGAEMGLDRFGGGA